jgi:hypothetical protein
MAEKIHHLWLMKLNLMLSIVAAAAVLQSQVGSEVSIAEIDKTLHAIDVDRSAASDGERAAAEYLDRKLAEYGVAHTKYEARLYLSWPGGASVTVDGLPMMNAKTAAFAAPTPPDGVAGPLIVNPTLTRRVDQALVFGPEVRSRIPVVRGISDTEALVLAGQRAGARAIVQIDATDTLHEDIVTTTWGTPTTEGAERLPAIPFVTITKSDGERLLGAAAKGVTARVTADVTRGWRREPIVVAEVPGASPDFVLVATHLDAWYHGMTDTGGSDASILEMARVLHKHKGELARGVRFAWWTGHSFGRYAGSAWYVDRFWADLDRYCVAYTNLDGPGRRGSRVDAVSASGWPGLAEYARESAARISGKTPAGGRGGGNPVFRPGRDSDSSFQGLGIPFFSIGVPGPSQATGDIDAAGRVAYWHAPDDTYDKLDLHALELDTKYRLAQIYELATLPLLPHRIEPIAASYVAELKDLSSAAGAAFDLSSTLKLAGALDDAAWRFDHAPRTDAALFNAIVVHVTHELNATLYTRTGRFDQDPAAALPVLPLLARVKDLATLSKDSDEYGFLETELIRGRNTVDATLRHVLDELATYEGHR